MALTRLKCHSQLHLTVPLKLNDFRLDHDVLELLKINNTIASYSAKFIVVNCGREPIKTFEFILKLRAARILTGVEQVCLLECGQVQEPSLDRFKSDFKIRFMRQACNRSIILFTSLDSSHSDDVLEPLTDGIYVGISTGKLIFLYNTMGVLTASAILDMAGESPEVTIS